MMRVTRDDNTAETGHVARMPAGTRKSI
jgi:hypothetical protein